jgi:predicted flavoprotein YhiN
MTDAGNADADVLVIGGGAAGLMAASAAARAGARVLVLEKTGRCGQKLFVSGKGRCNLTNAAELRDFIAMYGPKGRFLHSAFSRFFRPELLEFFGRRGLETRTERGGRIFPASGDARDVVGLFERELADAGVRVLCHTPVSALAPRDGGGFVADTGRGRFAAPCVILAAGGASWPETGSAGEGFVLAAALDHTVVRPRPALVPLVVREQALARSLGGVDLRNVRAAAFAREAAEVDSASIPARDYGRGERKKARPPLVESRFGELGFTPFGLGGPVILMMSLAVVDALASGPVSILIDLKPALSREQLRRRLRADLDQRGGRSLLSIWKEYVPLRMARPLLELAGLDGSAPARGIGAAGRERLIGLLKALPFNVERPLPLARAIVTAGGVALDEIDPRTLESRRAPGLFLAGEVIDLDADTGGYNLQAAFSTGHVAGESAARRALSLL